MYCGKCGADKGDLVLCPVCEGGGVNNGSLAAKKMKMIRIGTIISTALAILVFAMPLMERSIKLFEDGYFLAFTAFLRLILACVVVLSPLISLLIFVIRKGRKSVYISFAALFAYFIITRVIYICQYMGELAKVTVYEWEELITLYTVYIVLAFLRLGVYLLQGGWISTLFFGKKKSKGFVRCSPYVLAGAELLYYGIYYASCAIVSNSTGIHFTFFEKPVLLVAEIVAWTSFYFFITKYLIEIPQRKPKAKKIPAFAPAYGAPAYMPPAHTPPAYTPPVNTPPSAPAPMGESMFAPEPQPIYPPQPVPQPVYQPAPREKSDEEVIATLKKYKELLDSGIITQEEFDRKKDQLLK